ncbi:putative serine/threonine protein kinase KKQ8 [Nakaseomyces bracarensis]|uniref:putative serine/threonine protein kinase KKQ8 n=1 Tax=Nakaseomyces bracarensis TaxID=273131 RepID=UPI003871675D
MRSLFKSQRSRASSDRERPEIKVNTSVSHEGSMRSGTPVGTPGFTPRATPGPTPKGTPAPGVFETPVPSEHEPHHSPRHHLGIPNILKLNLTTSHTHSKSGSPESQHVSQESITTDSEFEGYKSEDDRINRNKKPGLNESGSATVRPGSPASSNGSAPDSTITTNENNIDMLLDSRDLNPFSGELNDLQSFPLPTGQYAAPSMKSPSSSRAPSRTNSRKDTTTSNFVKTREHAGTISAAQLSKYNESDSKCILNLEYFKLYEDGHHQHTLKVMSTVSHDGNGHSNTMPRNARNGEFETSDENIDVVRQKSKFSLSGFFKPHSKEDISNYDEKLKYAVSLLPKDKTCTKNQNNEPHSPIFSKTRSHVQKTSDGESEDEIDDPSIPKIVNKNAAVGSEELKLINKLSEKIRNGLSEAAKNRPTNQMLRTPSGAGNQKEERSSTFTDTYGRCVSVVGHGAYGVVKVCARPRTEEDAYIPVKTYMDEKRIYFAVKELKPRRTDPIEKFSTRITSEFIIGHSLSHYYERTGEQSAPNILNIIDLLEYNDTFIEVMEFCPAGDMYSLLTARKNKIGKALHPLEADCFMKQLLHGIKFMHGHGVAHCDLKPENILLHPNGLLKICDFGTSCVFQTAWEKHVHFQTGLQGSEPYVAPEEYYSKKEYDPRLVDCWSAGIVYCTMILGHYLWKNAARGKDSLYDAFYDDMHDKKEFYVFEELRHVNQEINRLRRIALYQIFQSSPSKRISVDKLLQTGWMRHTKCCIDYRNAGLY